ADGERGPHSSDSYNRTTSGPVGKSAQSSSASPRACHCQWTATGAGPAKEQSAIQGVARRVRRDARGGNIFWQYGASALPAKYEVDDQFDLRRGVEEVSGGRGSFPEVCRRVCLRLFDDCGP